MVNLVIIGILALVLGGACLYLVHAKRHGNHCVGCPNAEACHNAIHGSCSSKQGKTN